MLRHSVRLLVLFTIALAVGSAARTSAAQERLELRRYSIELPASWSWKGDGERWLVYPTGAPNECAIASLGAGMETGGSLTRADARRRMWATALGSRRVLQSNPTQEARDPSGRTWSVDTAAIEDLGAVYLLALSVVELNGRAEGFLMVATPQAVERYQGAIETMLYSVRPLAQAEAGAGVRDKAPPSGRPSPLGAAGAGRLAGVWTATTHELRYGVGGLKNEPTVSELILFADGAALWGMPPDGLLGFDRAAHRKRWPERWGSYALRNGQLSVTRGAEERVYAVLANGVLERRYLESGKERIGERFLPRPSFDGTRFDGEVRRRDHWPAPGNTSGIGTLPGCTFAKDGRFRDEKLMWIVLPEREGTSKEAHAARVAPGAGRYRLEHWTLVLEYDDGRVNQVSFVATNREQPMKGAILNGYPVEPRP